MSHLPQSKFLLPSPMTMHFTADGRLWMQRRQWALSVLRKEGVRSVNLSPDSIATADMIQVLDIGCGSGALLETLVQPASSIYEEPIRPSSSHNRPSQGQLPSPVDSDLEDISDLDELHIQVSAS